MKRIYEIPSVEMTQLVMGSAVMVGSGGNINNNGLQNIDPD